MITTELTTRLTHALRACAPEADRAPAYLQAAIAEAVNQPGRLARATLLLASAKSNGMPKVAAVQLAYAVEFWHVASHLLDDLPCMDDAEQRRGRRCLHRVHGVPTTLLTVLGAPATRRRVERQLAQARRLIARLVDEDPPQAFLAQWHEAVFGPGGVALRAA